MSVLVFSPASLTASIVFNGTVAAPDDAIPNSFNLGSVSDALINQWVESNVATISGINVETPITVAGGEYSIASFMVLALVWCMSNMASMVSTSPKLQKSMGLRGVSSLAAVPVHYFLLDLLVDFAGSDWRIELWLLCVVLALVITFWVSKIVDRLAKEVQLTKLQIILALCLVILLPLVANTIFNSELMSYSFKFVGLLGVCLLLNQKSKIFFR